MKSFGEKITKILENQANNQRIVQRVRDAKTCKNCKYHDEVKTYFFEATICNYSDEIKFEVNNTDVCDKYEIVK